eukprot:scaffold44512_cov22-Tisochrysis_lutea.AAC.1
MSLKQVKIGLRWICKWMLNCQNSRDLPSLSEQGHRNGILAGESRAPGPYNARGVHLVFIPP